MKDVILAPSILSADFSNLGSAVSFIDASGAHAVHIDVMDGSFVPNITIGSPVVKALRPFTTLPFDVHLMTEMPQNHIESFVKAGADWITFHYEAATHHHRIIEQIHACGKKAGISIVPSTPVSILECVLPFVDVVLVMTVNPGFGGQKLIPACIDKVKELVERRKAHNFNYAISVDGGVNNDTLPLLREAGIDIAVSGSSFFSGALQWR